MNVKPVGSKLYVKLSIEKESKSGLVLVKKKAEWQEETILAEVVAVGPDFSLQDVAPGKVVLIMGHAGRWLDPELTTDPEVTHRIIEQDEVIAYFEEGINE